MDVNNNPQVAPTTEATPSSSATQPVPFKVWKPPKAGRSAAPPLASMSAILFYIEDEPQRSRIGDLPDSYFEPTTSEIVALHHSRVAERERLIDAPLKTSLIRDREQKQREARYPTVSNPERQQYFY